MVYNILHLARKRARIFVHGHYLFREASVVTDYVQGQNNILAYFHAKWTLLCLLPFK